MLFLLFFFLVRSGVIQIQGEAHSTERVRATAEGESGESMSHRRGQNLAALKCAVVGFYGLGNFIC